MRGRSSSLSGANSFISGKSSVTVNQISIVKLDRVIDHLVQSFTSSFESHTLYRTLHAFKKSNKITGQSG